MKHPLPDFTPISARVAVLLRKAHEHCKGEDAAWDAWAATVIAAHGKTNLGTVAMPITADAFLRGLQRGLKAHIPIELDRLEEATPVFAKLTLNALIRQETSVAFAALQINDASKVFSSVTRAEEAFKKLGIPA